MCRAVGFLFVYIFTELQYISYGTPLHQLRYYNTSVTELPHIGYGTTIHQLRSFLTSVVKCISLLHNNSYGTRYQGLRSLWCELRSYVMMYGFQYTMFGHVHQGVYTLQQQGVHCIQIALRSHQDPPQQHAWMYISIQKNTSCFSASHRLQLSPRNLRLSPRPYFPITLFTTRGAGDPRWDFCTMSFTTCIMRSPQ